MSQLSLTNLRANETRRSKAYVWRVGIRNFKSIDRCDIALFALTALVGRNAAGKSNFLDALRFVVDSLQTSLDHAIRSRGGIEEVRRRSTGHPRNLAIDIEIEPSGYGRSTYAFEIAARGKGGIVVKRESLKLRQPGGEAAAEYTVEEGAVVSASSKTMPPATADRLYLVTAAGLPDYRPVYDALLSMGFYNLNPDAMKELQIPDAGELLHRDGANIASVVARLTTDNPNALSRIRQYLEAIVPGVTEVARAALGPKETLEFRQAVKGAKHPWKFYASSMSDGTLRALGTLVAVMQLADRRVPVSLVGIEEPETALHPAAAGALMDALREAATHTQILMTSHSPDLLDRLDAESDGILVVVSRDGNTAIAPMDSASRSAIKDHLYSPGELLRMDQLEPDEADLERQRQFRLFDDEEPQ